MPRRLGELTRAERRRALVGALVRSTVSAAAVIGLYYVLPLDGQVADAGAWFRLLIGIGVFLLVMVWQVGRIQRAPLPQLRALEAMAVAFFVFIAIYASTYVALSHLVAGSFSEHLGRTSGLYFAIVTFGTVGYGDIIATNDSARLIVSSQILLDLVFIGLVIRVLIAASRHSLGKRAAPSEPAP